MSRTPWTGDASSDPPATGDQGEVGAGNPYRPPAMLDGSASARAMAETLPRLEIGGPPLQFAGTPGETALRSHLKQLDSVGFISIVLLFTVGAVCLVGSLGILVVSVTLGMFSSAGVSMAAISAAIGLLVLLGAMTSSPGYRLQWHRNRHPGWNALIQGEISTDGVTYRRNGQSVTARWDWFAGAVVGKHSVCLMPAKTELLPI